MSRGRHHPESQERCRNDSGLVMKVRNRHEDKDWLLTGEADYMHMPNPLSKAAAITVPHKGASKCRTDPPKPSRQSASRLLYSFGPRNKHSRNGVSHPHRATVDAHVSRQLGWISPGWKSKTPGYAVTGGHHACNSAALPHLPRLGCGWLGPNPAADPPSHVLLGHGEATSNLARASASHARPACLA